MEAQLISANDSQAFVHEVPALVPLAELSTYQEAAEEFFAKQMIPINIIVGNKMYLFIPFENFIKVIRLIFSL